MALKTIQKLEFNEHVNGDSLELAIDWIQDHIEPNDVFEASELNKWVGKNAKPGDVFDDEDLEAWAEANGFVKEAP